MGEEVLAGGEGERAVGIFAQIAEIAPESAAAQSGLIRALIAAGHKDEAAEVLAALDPKLAGRPGTGAGPVGARPCARCACAKRAGWAACCCHR